MLNFVENQAVCLIRLLSYQKYLVSITITANFDCNKFR